MGLSRGGLILIRVCDSVKMFFNFFSCWVVYAVKQSKHWIDCIYFFVSHAWCFRCGRFILCGIDFNAMNVSIFRRDSDQYYRVRWKICRKINTSTLSVTGDFPEPRWILQRLVRDKKARKRYSVMCLLHFYTRMV